MQFAEKVTGKKWSWDSKEEPKSTVNGKKCKLPTIFEVGTESKKGLNKAWN
jgi:hypothetical protein